MKYVYLDIVKYIKERMAEEDFKYPSQEELCEYLIGKLRNFKNVTITTRPIKNTHGICYGIDVKNYTLSNLSNSVFHSLALRTVSHTSRVINIKLVFSDNEQRNADMKVNADAIMQIFREISNTVKSNGDYNKTLENVRIEEFTDNRGNKHLAILGESTRGASLIYAYLRSMDFVKTINEKYANVESTNDIPLDLDKQLDMLELSTKPPNLEQKYKELKQLQPVPKPKVTISIGNKVVLKPSKNKDKYNKNK